MVSVIYSKDLLVLFLNVFENCCFFFLHESLMHIATNLMAEETIVQQKLFLLTTQLRCPHVQF